MARRAAAGRRSLSSPCGSSAKTTAHYTPHLLLTVASHLGRHTPPSSRCATVPAFALVAVFGSRSVALCLLEPVLSPWCSRAQAGTVRGLARLLTTFAIAQFMSASSNMAPRPVRYTNREPWSCRAVSKSNFFRARFGLGSTSRSGLAEKSRSATSLRSAAPPRPTGTLLLQYRRGDRLRRPPSGAGTPNHRACLRAPRACLLATGASAIKAATIRDDLRELAQRRRRRGAFTARGSRRTRGSGLETRRRDRTPGDVALRASTRLGRVAVRGRRVLLELLPRRPARRATTAWVSAVDVVAARERT